MGKARGRHRVNPEWENRRRLTVRERKKAVETASPFKKERWGLHIGLEKKAPA